MRTCVYIDGFNLYYRALRGTPHRWLDLAAMARAALAADHAVEKIKYYTAHVWDEQILMPRVDNTPTCALSPRFPKWRSSTARLWLTRNGPA